MNEEKALESETIAKGEVMPTESITDSVEDEKTPSYMDSLNELRTTFDKKLNDLKIDYESKLKEREEIINQLLSEEKTIEETNEQLDIIKRINERRERSKF